MSDPIIDLSSVLTIVKANDEEKLYIMEVKSATTDSTIPGFSVGDPLSKVDLMMTGILDGNEKYIRYNKKEIQITSDSGDKIYTWSPLVLTETPRDMQKLEAIRRYLVSQGKEL